MQKILHYNAKQTMHKIVSSVFLYTQYKANQVQDLLYITTTWRRKT